MSTPIVHALASLNRDIAQLESETARLAIERAALGKVTGKLIRHRRYLRLASRFRAPRDSIAAYPLAVLTVGPFAIGVFLFVALSLLFSGWSLAFGGFLVGTLFSAGAFASLLFLPANERLPSAIADTDAKLEMERNRLEAASAALADARGRLAKLQDERHDLANAEKLQRAMLLQRNWKAMRGTEWEDFVVEVCRTLGANVYRGDAAAVSSTMTATGPRGVVRHPPTPLFVTFSPRRIAAVAVSEIRPFHTAAVQQIVADLARHGSDALAIVTNTRVTAGSTELARSRNCTLIGEDEFPDFVLGKVTL